MPLFSGNILEFHMISNVISYTCSSPFADLLKSSSLGEVSLSTTADIQTALEKALLEFKHTDCTAEQHVSIGFCNPFDPFSDSLTHCVSDFIAIGVKRQVKKVPADHIKSEVNKAKKLFEAENGSPMKTKQVNEIKEALINSLLPHIIPSSSVTLMVLDVAKSRVMVAASTGSKAEDGLSLLRKAIGSLPIVQMFDPISTQNLLQSWGKGKDIPDTISVGHAIKFSCMSEEKAVANFANVMISSPEIQEHFNDKLCVQLELVKLGDAPVTFTLKDSCVITGIRADLNTDNNSENEDKKSELDSMLFLNLTIITEIIEIINDALSKSKK